MQTTTRRAPALLIGCFSATMLLAPTLALAQSQSIKGVVVDETGEPLVGASVRVEGTSTGTATDIDGKFSLTLPSGKKMLLVSYVGYNDLKIAAKNGMRITLVPDAKAIDVVVVTGMVTQDKRLFTGASDKLKADQIKLDGVPDVSRGLEGRSAGVSVQNVSGTFGAAPKIRVRGATSILGSSKPLWVVDGVIQEDVVEVGADDLASGDATTLISSAIAGLNADDIESFQVLKDGSATSIYGAKAMAGVIVITTKKGRAGQSSFSYTGEFTSRLVPSYREFNIMNSQEQMDFYHEMQQKGWLQLNDLVRSSSTGIYGKMYHLINTYDPTRKQFLLPNTPEAQREYLRAAELRNTDWFGELFSPAIMQSHSISMSTGTEKSQTYVSLSTLIDPGWSIASKVNRYTGSFNNTYNFDKQISLTTIGSLSYRKQRAPGTFSQKADPVTGTVSREFDINPYSYALNSSRTLDPNQEYPSGYAPFNIYKELENNYIDFDVMDLKMQTELKWKPLKGLSLSALGAFRYSHTDQEHKITERANAAEVYRAMGDATIIDHNNKLYKDPDKPNTLPFSILPSGGFFYQNTYKMLGYDFRASATYNTEFEGGHILNSYAGVEFNAQNRTQKSFDGWGMQYDSGEVPYWDYFAFKQLREQGAEYYALDNTFVRTHALFATATYSYKTRYTLTGTFRYEGSNRLGKSRKARWLPTWNIAAAWNAHQEAFFKQQHVLSHLTTKASYSLTADAGPANNSAVIIRSGIKWRPQGPTSEPYNNIEDYENEDLTYEKKNELNLGIDAGFLEDRINLSVDYYTRRNFDLIGHILTQFGNRIGNVATMKSSGIELTLQTHNIKSKKFSWSTDFIFGYATNKITNLRSRKSLLGYVSGSGFAREGYPVRALFSIPFTGLDHEGFPTFWFIDKTVSKEEKNFGDIRFQEQDNLDFLKYEGPTDPLYTGSLGNVFTLGNFKLNVFITYSGGNKIRLDPVFKESYDDLTATPRDFKNRWAVVGDEHITDIPVLASQRDKHDISDLDKAYKAYNYSSARVAKGDFVRLKEISLTYTLPSSWLKGKLLKTASLKLQATNLCLLYADKKLNGQDPEFFRSGGVASPVAKQLTATIRLGF